LKYILKKRGGQGDAPLGLLPPPREREGHSPGCHREYTNRDKRGFQQSRYSKKNEIKKMRNCTIEKSCTIYLDPYPPKVIH
jgi:hypothetical protein